jgi:hypothetical protein
MSVEYSGNLSEELDDAWGPDDGVHHVAEEQHAVSNDKKVASDNEDMKSASDNDEEKSASDNDEEKSASDNDEEKSASDNDDMKSASDNDEEHSELDVSDEELAASDNKVVNRDKECIQMVKKNDFTWIVSFAAVLSALTFLQTKKPSLITEDNAPILFVALLCRILKYTDEREYAKVLPSVGKTLHDCFGAFDLSLIDYIYNLEHDNDIKVKRQDLLDSMITMSCHCEEFSVFNKKIVDTYLQSKPDRTARKRQRVHTGAMDRAMNDYLAKLVVKVGVKSDIFTKLYMFVFDKVVGLLCPEFTLPPNGVINISKWSSLSHTVLRIISIDKNNGPCMKTPFFNDSNRIKIVTIVHFKFATQSMIAKVLSDDRLPNLLKSILVGIESPPGVQEIVKAKVESILNPNQSSSSSSSDAWFTHVYKVVDSMASIVVHMAAAKDDAFEAYVKSFVTLVVEKLLENKAITFKHNLIGEWLLRFARGFEKTHTRLFRHILVKGPHIKCIMELHGEKKFRVNGNVFGRLIETHSATLCNLYEAVSD